MTKTLFCISPYQAWLYHTNCDIRTIEYISDGFKPDKLLIITCDGGLNHCDLRENIKLATGCSDKSACKQCCINKAGYISRLRELALRKQIMFEQVEIVLTRNDMEENKKDRAYYFSEVCSYYRLDELSLEKIRINQNSIVKKLSKQSSSLKTFFEKVIDSNEHSLGIAFNGRLSPYSDLINWCKQKNINVIVHERGRMDGLMNIRLNRKALDQQEFNYLISDYIKTWTPSRYPQISKLIENEFVNKGNLTSRIWKHNTNKPLSFKTSQGRDLGAISVALFLSSTDEAYDDDGTLLLELQIMMMMRLIKLKQKGFIKRIIVKTHPDMISRIDLTVQHTIVTRLLQEEDDLEIYWPESKITSAELISQSNIIMVPHSSIAIELASHGVPFITFQDSPFKYIADTVMSIGAITDEELLKICIEKQIEEQKNEEINSRKKEEKLSKLVLSWLLWDSVVNADDKLIDKSVDKSVTNEGIRTLRRIGELEGKKLLNSCSLRDLFIKQAGVINNMFEAHELLKEECGEESSNKVVRGKQSNKINNVEDIYGTDKGTAVIISKWRDVPNEIKEGMENGVVLANGLYIYDKFLAILFGWNVPRKAKRSWDLMTSQKMREFPSMCLTLNKDIDKRVRDIWSLWKCKKSSDWDEIYQREEFKYILEKEEIKCYTYREPIVVHDKD